MNRRAFVLALGALLAPVLALAQARKVRIGVLATRQRSVFLPAIVKRLSELGYVEGENLVLDYRSADGVVERLPSLARALIAAKCDVIIDIGVESSVKALIKENPGIPVVILAITYDPVSAGIVPSLHRPGGNVTGMVMSTLPLAAKRLELLREIFPKARRVLMLVDPFSRDQLEFVQQAARQLRVEVVTAEFTAPPYDFESGFAKGAKAGVDALLVPASPVFLDNRLKIHELAMERRLAIVGSTRPFAEAGFLVTYGINSQRVSARVGDIVASILKGKKPGEIPIEQPTEFELVVNLKTAKALGITIPPSITFRADRMIQ